MPPKRLYFHSLKYDNNCPNWDPDEDEVVIIDFVGKKPIEVTPAMSCMVSGLGAYLERVGLPKDLSHEAERKVEALMGKYIGNTPSVYAALWDVAEDEAAIGIIMVNAETKRFISLALELVSRSELR